MEEIDRRYSDLGLGLVDGSVVALAERLGIRRVATHDVRHFAAVRLRDGSPLELRSSDRARSILSPRVRRFGYFCVPTLMRDPWLHPLRTNPEFTRVVARAEALYRQALLSFQAADGNRVFGLAMAA